MPPYLALSIWILLLVLLLRFDPAKLPGTSWIFWVPVIWVSIVASRLPSQWLGTTSSIDTVAEALEEGNPLNRTVWLVLILLALGILLSRSFPWGEFIARNLALIAYLSFALMSVLWSDFAFVSFKRWFRDLGTYLMIFIVLSDPRPYEAVRTLLRRVCYLLIPLSIILIKYFDKLGRVYDQWTGMASNVGVTTTKNMLGVLCLVSALFFFWDTLTHWADRKQSQTKRILFVNFGFMLMTLYLLRLAHSATSTVCVGVGCMVIAAAHSTWGRRHSTFLKAIIPTSFCVYLILGFGLGLNATFAQMLGKDPTLTDRTKIWAAVLSMDTNPLIGTGYESFWLGPRLDVIAEKVGEHITEAHNGYIEVYLNLGVIGVILLICILIAAYRNICRRQLVGPATFNSLTFAFWAAAVFYNVAEASFKHGLMWMGVLLAAIALPEREQEQIPIVDLPDAEQLPEETPAFVGFADWRP